MDSGKVHPAFVPNTTQTLNLLYDWVFPTLGEAELKCLLYVVRRTYGFRKDTDRISLSQFVDGLTSRDGDPLDMGAGVSRPSAVAALDSLREKGLISVSSNGQDRYYGLNLTGVDKLVKSFNQLNDLTSKTALPELVKRFNPQKKEKKSKGEGTPQNPPDKMAGWFEDFWSAYPRKIAKPNAITAFRRLKPTSELLASILADIGKRVKSDQWTRDDGRFIPHPATYLNQRRWEDVDTGVDSGRISFVDLKKLAAKN